MSITPYPGYDAVKSKGWLHAHKWLVARRISQVSILALFYLGPWFGIWMLKGNLSASLLLDSVPLTDPYLILQSIIAGNLPLKKAFIGAAIVTVFYFLVGGRTYCAWVCPLNLVTDTAHWLRTRIGIRGASSLNRNLRYWLFASTLVLTFISGSILWETINPVSMLHRGLLYGMGLGWFVILMVFLLDLLILRRGWCGHLCPVGAFYSLLGRFSLLRIRADNRSACNDCMDCFLACPEQQVIKPALKGAAKNINPVINSANCTNCGRCIDVCNKDVFHFGLRFDKSVTETTKTTRPSLHSPGVKIS